jgi:RHS repeat-associated protein
VTSYSWTDFNRLKAISTSDDSKKQSHTFGISGFRRKKKDKDDVETTEYAAGLSTEVSKVTSGETITYLKGGGGIMGFERSSDGAMFWFITDALSTVRDVVRGTDGAVMASYEFDEYGRRIATSESGVSTQKTFVGGMSVQDEVVDTGLMMMGHRFYAPDLGRFLNRDPIGFAGGANLYEYAVSSPMMAIDPTGLQVVEAGTGSALTQATNIILNLLAREAARPAPLPVKAWTITILGTTVVSLPVGYAAAASGLPAASEYDDIKRAGMPLNRRPELMQGPKSCKDNTYGGRVLLYHGSLRDSARIMKEGLTFRPGKSTDVTTNLETAMEALSFARYEVQEGLVKDPSVIMSLIERKDFEEHFLPNIDYEYRGFGGNTPGNQIHMTEQIQYDIFNAGIVGSIPSRWHWKP